MLIPACRAYSTSYCEGGMPLAGSQTNGYSRAAIPSVEAAIAQPSCTMRQISQAMPLMGRRSTRAAISPGMTKAAPPPALAPAVSCAITVLLAAIQFQGDGSYSGEY